MLEFRDVSLSYGGAPVLSRCSLRVKPGERAALMGPSGCGKTTLLRCAAGLAKPDRGQVRTGGRVSVAFQEPRLFPWLTAEENLRLVCPAPGDALRWLKKAGLPEAAGKRPPELSGGMRQRLSLCRALAWGGDILLLDEPFQGLDLPLREKMAELVRREWQGKTLLLVTHDPADLVLADAVYEFRNGTFVLR